MSRDRMDTIDRRLIGLLQSNSRESTTNLAKKLRIARTTVHERIGRLERSGVIQGYTILLSQDPFDSYIQCHMLLEIVRANQNVIVQQLSDLPELRALHAMNGECDLLCFAVVPLLEDLEALVAEISQISGVKDVRTMIVMTAKFDHRSGGGNSRVASQAAAISLGEAG